MSIKRPFNGIIAPNRCGCDMCLRNVKHKCEETEEPEIIGTKPPDYRGPGSDYERLEEEIRRLRTGKEEAESCVLEISGKLSLANEHVDRLDRELAEARKFISDAAGKMKIISEKTEKNALDHSNVIRELNAKVTYYQEQVAIKTQELTSKIKFYEEFYNLALIFPTEPKV